VVLAVGVVGTFLGYLLHCFDFPGKTIIEKLLLLPLVLPPIVLGFYLIPVLGRNGLPQYLGIPNLVFTLLGGGIAVSIVCLPMMIKTAKSTFDMMPQEFLEVSYTLGKGRVYTFFHVTMPLCLPGLLSGLMLSMARALGEFGASLMILGNIPGQTTTMPLAVWFLFSAGREEEAFKLVLILTGLSIALIWLAESISKRGISAFGELNRVSG
jgi:molybdate transport system permease protein